MTPTTGSERKLDSIERVALLLATLLDGTVTGGPGPLPSKLAVPELRRRGCQLLESQQGNQQPVERAWAWPHVEDCEAIGPDRGSR